MIDVTVTERVARAIHAAYTDLENEDVPDAAVGDPWPEGGCVDCIILARAAIEAMREPTEAMIEAAGLGVTVAPDDRGTVRDMWQAMVNAALAETEAGDA
jgi:hypothetical protein